MTPMARTSPHETESAAVVEALAADRPPRTFRDLAGRARVRDLRWLTRWFRKPPTEVMLFRPAEKKSKPELKTAPPDALLFRPAELGDLEVLGQVLGAALRWAENKASSAFSASELEREVSGRAGAELRRALEDTFAKESLPAGFGAVKRNRTWLFVRVDHFVRGASLGQGRAPGPDATGPAPSGSAVGFGAAFDAAFDELDAMHRGLNFVKLKDLRDALSAWDRETFDAELRRLRVEQRYDLVPNEGTHMRLTEEERAAGIVEAGSRLVICRRVDALER